MIIDEMAVAFTEEGKDIQALYGATVEAESLAIPAGELKRYLAGINLLPDSEIMKDSEGLVNTGTATLHIIANEPSEAVEGLLDFLTLTFQTPVDQGIGKPHAPYKLGIANPVTFWAFWPTSEISLRAERMGKFYRVTQDITFAARLGDHT